MGEIGVGLPWNCSFISRWSICENVLGNIKIEDRGDRICAQSSETQSFNATSEDLFEYRSKEIPKEEGLADSNNGGKKWAEHLSHQENTRSFLEYYGGLNK